MINESNIGSIHDKNNNNKRVTMVIILVTMNRKLKLKSIKQWLNKLIFYKQAVPIIHKAQYIGKIKSGNSNIISW